jgi:iron complex transport system substrate-binding protein
MFPERIICLSGESADICGRLGAAGRVVAVSAFAPAEMRAGRRIVGGFSTLKQAELLALKPDLVITFSDVQAQIAADLIRSHCTVLATNQRSLRQIAEAILLIGRAIGCAPAAEELARDFQLGLEHLRAAPAVRPRVYFEEWDEPLIAGIGWVSEAIALVGGEDICAGGKASRERQVDPARIVSADPEIILASWCGKPVDLHAIAARPGWDAISAVRTGRVHALDSDNILQPGPRVLTGIAQMRELIARPPGA